MADTYFILAGDFSRPSGNRTETETHDPSGEEIKRSLRIINTTDTINGHNIQSGNLIYETVEKVQQIQFDYKEETTHDQYVLKSDREGNLELVQSSSKKGDDESDINFESSYQLEANQDNFHIINREVILLEGDIGSLGLLRGFIDGDIHRARINVDELIDDLYEDGVVESVSSANFENVDPNTESVSISGDIKESPIAHDTQKQGDTRWFMGALEVYEKELMIGFSDDGAMHIYSPVSYPIEDVCDFTMEYIHPIIET